MRTSLLAAALAVLLVPATAGAVDPYGANDAGGFRNVLPPGANGHDNALDLATFLATGARPAHWDDQQPLYDGLVKAAPALHDDLDRSSRTPPSASATVTSARPGSRALG